VTNAKKLLKNHSDADELVEKLLVISQDRQVCLLDSAGVRHLGSHFLLGGIDPLETFEISFENPQETLRFLDEKLEQPDIFAFFTISYEFGLKLEKIKPRPKEFKAFDEPDIFLALFDSLLVHDYLTHETFLCGSAKNFARIEKLLGAAKPEKDLPKGAENLAASTVESNFTKAAYTETIEKIKESIRRGTTYQTNLTQQLRARLPETLTPQQIFRNLRKNHPAPFAAFFQRQDSCVISASPERFIKVDSGKLIVDNAELKVDSENPSNYQLSTINFPLIITTSPIKGTRPRGENAVEDEKLKNELLNSEKDRAENVMIVDLLRNDLGRICEFGTVRVKALCELEEHSTLFHLVSTIEGALRPAVRFSEMIRAVFPCGSITGAPKISTMRIIDQLETAPRGLSMGAIGYCVSSLKSQVPSPKSQVPSLKSQVSSVNFSNQQVNSESKTTWDLRLGTWDSSVAIRTMVIRGREAIFNVGGGIVIDSSAEDEYNETLVKAKALLAAINGALSDAS
jgi:anthranilate/para-aminobenzoate synthase component I